MLATVIADPFHGQLARARHAEIRRAILVAESVTADHDRIGPAGDQPRHVGYDDRLAEDAAAEDVADRAVGRFPHLLQAEFLDARLVGSDRRALHANAVLLDRIRRVDRDLVVGRVAVLDGKVVVEKVHVEIRLDQPLANPLPDDPRHLVAVELDDRVLHLDLGHVHSCDLEIWRRLRMQAQGTQPRRCA
jgi:hypothetical protein